MTLTAKTASLELPTGNTFFPPMGLRPLSLAIGLLLAQPALSADYPWSSGNFSTSGIPSSLSATDTLQINQGGTKYLDSPLTSSGTITANDHLYFQYFNPLTNNGLYDAQTDVGLYNSYAGGNFVNGGTFKKSGGTGTTSIGSISFSNTGTIQADTGTISFDSGSAAFYNGTIFTGNGQVAVTSNAYFNGSFTSANLQLKSGTFNGDSAKISGSIAQPNSIVNWIGGYLTGDWTVDANQKMNLVSGGAKYVVGSLANNGVISASDDLYFQYGNKLTNNGVYDVKGDFGLYDGYASGAFINNGTFTKSAGTGTTTIGSAVHFTNNGVINTETGTISFSGGNVTFNDGSAFKGAGQVVVGNNAQFNGNFSTENNLSLTSGGFAGTNAKLANGSANWSGGYLYGNWEVGTGQTLNLLAGGTKYVDASVLNSGTIAATDDLYFQYGFALTNNGLYDVKGDFGLYDGYASGVFTNNGTFTKSAGTGTTAIGSAIYFINNGAINAETGTISFSGGNVTFNDGSAFKGAGQVVVGNNAQFNGNFSTANNLSLTNGSLSGTNAKLVSGSANWIGGTLFGNWEVGTGQTLNLLAGGTKYVDAAVLNSGTIAATDDLYFQYGYSLTNNGVYDVKGNFGLYNSYASGVFTNNGTFTKSAGTGDTAIGGAVYFTNNGAINAETGTISFSGGNATFNDGTVFKGAGQVVVGNNAQFNGNFSTANNLSLTNGSLSGTNAKLVSGSANWIGGTLFGNWEVGAGQTLNLLTGGTKYIDAAVINNGTIAANDHLYLQYGYSLTNNGVYDVNGDFGLHNGYAGGYVANNGSFVKSGGTGTTDLSSISFANNATGSLEIQTGTVQLANGFDNQGIIDIAAGANLTITGAANMANEGSIQGLGSINANLTNNGTLTPGTLGNPGTLNIVGNYVQTGTGIFDVQLGAANQGLLNITGNAIFEGALNLTALSGFTTNIGETFTIAMIGGTASYNFTNTSFIDSRGDIFQLSLASVASGYNLNLTATSVAAVPVPAAFWLFGSAMIGFIGLRKSTATV